MKTRFFPLVLVALAFAGKSFSMDVEHQFYSVLLADYDPTPQFGRITPPVFLALGRYDYAIPYALWTAEKAKLPDVSFHFFENSGHWPMLEEQALFDRLLIEWLRQTKR
jgi:proline iminopeptidase